MSENMVECLPGTSGSAMLRKHSIIHLMHPHWLAITSTTSFIINTVYHTYCNLSPRPLPQYHLHLQHLKKQSQWVYERKPIAITPPSYTWYLKQSTIPSLLLVINIFMKRTAAGSSLSFPSALYISMPLVSFSPDSQSEEGSRPKMSPLPSLQGCCLTR